MKKKLFWTSLALISLLSILALRCQFQGMLVKTVNNELHYYINHPTTISLDPLESDSLVNQVLMKHLVGTLLRYANGGQFEPYLAESFTSTKNKTEWSFKLRKDLQCENGEPITAQGYLDGFLKMARVYSKDGPVPILSDLDGWSEFTAGHSLKGVVVNDPYQLTFHFTKPADSGFLEYLSMPYYGYFCAANFDNEKWRQTNSIVSSGPYKLKSISSDQLEATLNLRSDWPRVYREAPKVVKYIGKINADAWKQRHSVIQQSLGWNDLPPKGFRKISGPPDNIRSILLDNGPSQFFKDSDARKVFQNKVFEIRKRLAFLSKSADLANSFYPGFEFKPDMNVSDAISHSKPKEVLQLISPPVQSDETKYMLQLAESALKELNWDYKLIVPDKSNGFILRDINTKNKFDLRISNVVAGSVMDAWVVDMMFCSSLGVSFPDPSGRVCARVKKVMGAEIPYDPQVESKEISKIVFEDAAVIPIYHGRTTWYFSNDLDVSRIGGDLILPSFEEIGLPN